MTDTLVNERASIQAYWERSYGASRPRTASPRQTRLWERLRPYVPRDGEILEIGGGANNLSHFFDPARYVSLDISANALKTLAPNAAGVAADAADMPFDAQRFSLVFEQSFLEHVLRPDRVCEEIDRVLSDGGVVFHGAAWFCRPVGALKWLHRAWRACSPWQKVVKALVHLRHSRLVRGLCVIPARLCCEIRYAMSRRPRKLAYRPLAPDFTLPVTDATATAAIDPFQVIWFYRSRGYTVADAGSLLERLLFHAAPVIARKSPAGTERQGAPPAPGRRASLAKSRRRCRSPEAIGAN